MNAPAPPVPPVHDDPIRVCMVCHPTYGGSGVVASELGMRLASRGHEVHFVSYQLPFRVDDSHPNVHFHEVEVSQYPLFRYPPYALALATELVGVVRTAGARLIHAHYAIPHSISAYLTKQMCKHCDIRTITTLHGTDITLVGSDASFRDVTRFAIGEADAVTAVSSSLREDTAKTFDVARSIDVIPNFVDPALYRPDRFDRELRRRFAADDERLLVHVSNFRPVKRVRDVVRIFDRVHRDVPSRLLLIGTGPERHMAEEEVRRRGIEDRVDFVGSVARVEDHLAICDALLLPSETESFGLAALEAMASGVPVVATRAGGLPELVDDGVDGILEEVGDCDALGSRAARLLGDTDALERAAAAARDKAVRAFDIDRVVDQYEGLYRNVLLAAR